jgi:hypothetical protein
VELEEFIAISKSTMVSNITDRELIKLAKYDAVDMDHARLNNLINIEYGKPIYDCEFYSDSLTTKNGKINHSSFRKRHNTVMSSSVRYNTLGDALMLHESLDCTYTEKWRDYAGIDKSLLMNDSIYLHRGSTIVEGDIYRNDDDKWRN